MNKIMIVDFYDFFIILRNREVKYINEPLVGIDCVKKIKKITEFQFENQHDMNVMYLNVVNYLFENTEIHHARWYRKKIIVFSKSGYEKALEKIKEISEKTNVKLQQKNVEFDELETIIRINCYSMPKKIGVHDKTVKRLKEVYSFFKENGINSISEVARMAGFKDSYKRVVQFERYLRMIGMKPSSNYVKRVRFKNEIY